MMIVGMNIVTITKKKINKNSLLEKSYYEYKTGIRRLRIIHVNKVTMNKNRDLNE